MNTNRVTFTLDVKIVDVLDGVGNKSKLVNEILKQTLVNNAQIRLTMESTLGEVDYASILKNGYQYTLDQKLFEQRALNSTLKQYETMAQVKYQPAPKAALETFLRNNQGQSWTSVDDLIYDHLNWRTQNSEFRI